MAGIFECRVSFLFAKILDLFFLVDTHVAAILGILLWKKTKQLKLVTCFASISLEKMMEIMLLRH